MANYLGYAQALNNQGNPLAEGIDKITGTMQQGRLMSLREAAAEREAESAGIHNRLSLASLQDTADKRAGLMAANKVGSMPEAYQKQEEAAQLKAKQDASMAKLTAFQNLKSSVAKDVQDEHITPEESARFMDFGIRAIGMELPKDVKFSFDKTGMGYYSGPINKDAYIDTGDGEYTTYGDMGGADGIVKGLKITDWAEDGRPILQMTKDTAVEKSKIEPTYKERTYNKGNQEITEVSTDNGLTWKPLSTAPRYKPAAEGGGVSSASKEERKAAIGELPKLRQDATSAKTAMPRINRMIEILDSGNAGSMKSYLQGMLAPIAPEAKGANEAELFQIYAKMVSGPQRVSIIGPGPQTEAEGRLLEKVGGGGKQGRAALRELLTMHKDGYVNKVEEYNGMVRDTGAQMYKPITLEGAAPPPKAQPANKGPKPGDIEDGYRFKGGDRANPKNWVKVGK